MQAIAPILFPLPFSQTFSYAVPPGQSIEPGSFVLCPWGKAHKVGILWPKSLGRPGPRDITLKTLGPVYKDIPPLSASFCSFLAWMSSYTLTPLGLVAKMAMPSAEVFAYQKKTSIKIASPLGSIPPSPHGFSPEQSQAIASLQKSTLENTFAPFLIDGVTGSGKTEVFLEAIAPALEKGRQVLFLLPEISLSPQLAERFYKRFQFKAALWHSDLTPAQRRETWKGVSTGQLKAVIGARSALFLPFQDLGFIVVDEEHSHSFKQEQGVIYHARDMAVARAKFEGCPIALVSATPSLETWWNTSQGRYQLCKLPERFLGAALPTVTLIDRRLEKKEARQSLWLSPLLIEALQATCTRGEQALLFLNRRGYAPLTLCHSCGDRLACKSCSAWLIYHKQREVLVCHHCGYVQSIPKHCEACQEEDSYIPCGPGVERLQEEIYRLFPQFRSTVMTSDTITSPKELEEILGHIHKGHIDIIIGTQMMAKGHHFPNLTLIGVVDADMSLMGGDLRATEKTFQLLHQVAGRAGREQKPGFVYLQTHAPDHPVFDTLVRHDRDAFMALEQEQRKRSQLPPFSRLAALILSSIHESKLIAYCQQLACHTLGDPKVTLLGPAPAPLYKRLKKYRYRFLLEAPRDFNLQAYIQAWIARFPPLPSINLIIDIDPYNFL